MAGNTALVRMAAGTDVGKRLHTLPSHQTLDEPRSIADEQGKQTLAEAIGRTQPVVQNVCGRFTHGRQEVWQYIYNTCKS